MRARRILADNVQAYLDLHYPAAKFLKPSYAQMEFAKDTGVSWSSVQRALDPQTGITLDVIADLAVAMEVKLSELLTMGFFTRERNADPFQKPVDPTADQAKLA